MVLGNDWGLTKSVQGPVFCSVKFERGEERAWFPPKGSSMVLPPWGGLNRMVFVLRGWGRHLDTLLIAHPTVVLWTCADRSEADVVRRRSQVDGPNSHGRLEGFSQNLAMK